MNIKNFFVLFAFIFLTVSTLGAAVGPIDYNNYADGSCYAAILDLDTDGDKATRWENLVKGSPGFNHKKDTDIIRSSQSGLLTRKAFIKLSDADFVKVVGSSLPFFSHPFGFSLIHGWMLNKFKDSTTPYYIGTYFSFDKFFFGMIGRLRVPDEAKNIIKRAWFSARKNVETNRWEYYDHMLYLPYAIDQVAADRSANPPLSIDMVMSMSHATPDAFYKQNAAAFRRAMSAKINAFLNSKQLAVADSPLEQFSDILAWVLAHHINLTNAILPADVSAANFQIEKFVNFITDRAFTLYEDKVLAPSDVTTLAQVKTADINAPGLQFGQAVQMYLLQALSSTARIIENDAQFKELVLSTVKEAIGKAKKAQVDAATLLIIQAEKIKLFSESPAPVRLAALPLSPVKKGAVSGGLLADETYLGNLGVYFTPIHWADGPLAEIKRFGLADILKTFESYLIKQKAEVDSEMDATKGANLGSMIGRTYLAEVRGWRYKLLSMAPNADATAAEDAARAFIVSNRGRDRFKTSMGKKQPK